MICVVTSSRSDFSLLSHLIITLNRLHEVRILVTGGHFSEKHGDSVKEVKNVIADLLPEKLDFIDVYSDVNSTTSHVKGLGDNMIACADYFEEFNFDCCVFLGDRWELLGVIIPAFLFRIPLVHISGGEITEGVIDDSIRHAFSQFSHAHCVANEQFARNLSKMGVEDWRISIVGECGLDTIFGDENVSMSEVSSEFGLPDLSGCLLVTFHPETISTRAKRLLDVEALIEALNYFDRSTIVITSPGLEIDAMDFIERFKEFSANRDNVHYVPHFGGRLFRVVLKNALVMIGNSSSGLVEAPSLGVPTVNIGDRQKGRPAAKSVISVSPEKKQIIEGILAAIELSKVVELGSIQNPFDPYGDQSASSRIMRVVTRLMELDREYVLKKSPYTFVRSKKWNYLLGRSYD